MTFRFLQLTLLGLVVFFTPGWAQAFPDGRPGPFPVRVLGGVAVIDTPIVRAAQDYARDHSNDELYNHIMRSWLFGALIVQHNETLRNIIDPEVHAVASILHDLGFDRTPNSTIVSADRRFEVDGAVASRDFIRAHGDGLEWEERRVQLVWDAIALHTDLRIALFKEPDVAAVGLGVSMDFSGPGFDVSEEEYDNVLVEFPRVDLPADVVETMTWLCRTKPESTYESFMQGFGDEFLPEYSAVGHRTVDMFIR